MEDAVPGVNMTTSAPFSHSFSLDAANELLAAFDIADDPESRAFLAELLASGSVPPEEVELLSKGSDRIAKRAARRRHAKSASRRSPFSHSPSPSPSKRLRLLKEEKTARDPHERNEREKNKPSKRSDTDLKATVSPFFEDDASTSSDEDEEEECVETTDRQAKDSISVPPLEATWTDTLVIYTRKVVLGGNEEQVAEPSSEPSASTKQTGSPKAKQHTQPEPRTPSPVKRLEIERRTLSPTCFSPISSPSKSTPQSKRKRETTSYFFTPPPSRNERRHEGSSDSEDSGVSDETDENSSSEDNIATPTVAVESTLKDTTPTRPRRGAVSGLPFPHLYAPQFGLVQEQLADDPFWLLIALVFLTRVAGRVSLPVFWAIKAQYPTPQALVDANPNELVKAMRHLGMASVRYTAIQRYARGWIARPPLPGVCTTVKNYPLPPEGSNEPAMNSQWEIGHLTNGAYAVDSWRIFCRDALLGRSKDWKGDTGGYMTATRHSNSQTESSSDTESIFSRSSIQRTDTAFQPEWMRVLPRDKELRACLRWMWMREGWDWDPLTGERTVLSEDLRNAVDEGRVGYDVHGQLQILEGGGKSKKKEELVVVI